MSKDELKQALEDKGVKVDGRWSEERLQKELDALAPVAEPAVVYTEAKIKQVEEELSGKNARPIEDLKNTLTRNEDGKLQRASGLLIPDSVFTGKTQTDWAYTIRYHDYSCVVERMMYNGFKEFVREYSLAVHGDKYKTLAEQFIFKKNNL